MGLGGLGHLAVLYAKAMGCDPVVFTRDLEKRSDALELGAKEFYPLPENAEQDVLETVGGINILLLCGGRMPKFDL